MSGVTPRIYVASLSDYNAGRLHGRWIDCDMDDDYIWDEIKAMLEESKEPLAEEHAIHDHEGFFGISIHENESIKDVAAIGQLLEEHGEAFALAYNNHGSVEAAEYAMQGYRGCYDTIEAWAEDTLEEQGVLASVPETIRYYIDFTGWAREQECGGMTSIQGIEGVHVFDEV